MYARIGIGNATRDDPLAVARPTDGWIASRDQNVDTQLRRVYAGRMPNPRLVPWRYHDMLLARYLAAFEGEHRPRFIVTGNSTMALNNLGPNLTIAGLLNHALTKSQAAQPWNIRSDYRSVLNIAVDGTAEAYLYVSIRSALALEPERIFAGITIRDLTQVDVEFAASESQINAFLEPQALYNDFTDPKNAFSNRSLAEARVRARSILMPTAPGQSPEAILELLNAGANSIDTRFQWRPVRGLYTSPMEMRRRADLKNAHRQLLLDANPFVKRLTRVMDAFAADAHRITWVLMPLNQDLDIDRFGLDRDIPDRLLKTVRDMARTRGYSVVSDLATWPGDQFSLDDVVHLNTIGSERMARLIVDSGFIPGLGAEHFDQLSPLIWLKEYQSAVSGREAAMTLQYDAPLKSVRFAASGLAHPYIAATPTSGSQTCVNATILESDPAPRVVVDAGGAPTQWLEIPASGPIHIERHGASTIVRVGDQRIEGVGHDVVVQLGYFDTSLGDREFSLALTDLGPAQLPLAPMARSAVSASALSEANRRPRPPLCIDDVFLGVAEQAVKPDADQDVDLLRCRLVATGEKRPFVTLNPALSVRCTIRLDPFDCPDPPRVFVRGGDIDEPLADVEIQRACDLVIDASNPGSGITLTLLGRTIDVPREKAAALLGFQDDSHADRELTIAVV